MNNRALCLAATVIAAAAVRTDAADQFSDRSWRAARVDGGRVAVAVELADEPSARTWARALAAPLSASATGAAASAAAIAAADRAAQHQLVTVEAAQRRLLPRLAEPAIGAEVIYRTQRVFNGIAAYVDPARVEALRALPGVKAVHPLVPDRLRTTTSVPYVGAPQVWQGVAGNLTGSNVSIGIIDSGIDYLHKDFGGSGVYTGQDFADSNVPWNAKVVGGKDLAGDAYTGSNTPRPDGDPMDLESVAHGTHVAGIVAGYGVESGETYGGSYNASADLSLLLPGPGVAPGARLYAIRVFGSGMSTSLTAQGIEWAVDPNGDGNLSDHLDVINLSLGSPFGTVATSTVTAVENAAGAGVIVVASAGNDGDTTYITSTPGVADGAISTAATFDDGSRGSDVRVNSPAEIAGGLSSLPAAFGGGTYVEGVTAQVVLAAPADACAALTNAAAVAGKIALIDRGTCTFVSKTKRAQDAGAVGVIIANNAAGTVSMGGSDASITIPAVSILQADGTRLKGKLPSPGVEATLTVLIYGGLVAPFSGRGPRYDGDALKPDIAAPGYQIASAYARSGTSAVLMSGTSMAAPHVTGAMALLKQLHPTWTPRALKALLINTGGDLWADINQQPPLVSPTRVGGGLVNLPAAAAATAIAYDADAQELVSLFFGTFEVADSATETRRVTVENRGGADATFALSYSPRSDLAGVDIAFPGGATVAVPAGGSTTFDVRLDAVAAAMRHDVDPSADVTQDQQPRFLPAEESGYVTLTPPTGGALRVPLYAAARPVGALAAAEGDLILGAAQGTLTVNLTGAGLDTGGSTASDIVSLVTPLELVYSATTQPLPRMANAWLRHVGVASDYAGAAGANLAATTLVFGIATAGDWATPNEVEFTVRIDTNRDGIYDYSLSNIDSAMFADEEASPSDVFGVQLCPTGGSCKWIGYLNRFSPAERDTVAFATNVAVLAVPASELGLAAGATAFDWRVVSGNAEYDTVSQTPKMTYDVAKPGLAPALLGPTPAASGGQIEVAYDRAAFTANGALGLLLLHHHNGAAGRAQALPATAADCTLTCSATVATHATVGVGTSFSGSAAATGCSPTIGYDWDFGDGTARGSGAATTHAYSNPGSYSWVMTATGSGLTCTSSGTVTADTTPGPRPPRRRTLQSLP